MDRFGEKSNEKVKLLLANLEKHFERDMNHDLDVETAIEGLFQHISKFEKLCQKHEVCKKDVQLFITKLLQIDTVLQIFGNGLR
jgi:hypothetical protein